MDHGLNQELLSVDYLRVCTIIIEDYDPKTPKTEYSYEYYIHYEG